LRDDVKAILEKSPCNANAITLEQMADTSMITPEQKSSLSKFRTENRLVVAKLHAAYAKHGGARGAKIIAVREQITQRTEENQLALYEGKLTWGDFNKRRNDITKQGMVELNTAIAAR
jgi:hypothetical protein